MLVGDFSGSPFPGEAAALPVDYPHCAGLPKTDQVIAVGGHVDAVAVGPFPPALQGADHILVEVQVLI